MLLFSGVMLSVRSSFTTGCLKKKYTKLINRNLKLIPSINNMLQFFNFTQSNLNFEPSFVGIHQVLREIRLFEPEFQICQQAVHRITEVLFAFPTKI